MPYFMDRIDAGRRLARAAASWARHAPVVVGISHGGVPVAAEVAHRLRAPLDVVEVARFGTPERPFATVGAVAEGGSRVLNAVRLADMGLTPDDVAQQMSAAARRVAERHEAWATGGTRHAWCGRTVVLVDDGMATGSTMHAAILALRAARVRRVVVAVPVDIRYMACSHVLNVIGALRRGAEPPPVTESFREARSWVQDFEEFDREDEQRRSGTSDRSSVS
jgi:putative phosphoribosyl transferase